MKNVGEDAGMKTTKTGKKIFVVHAHYTKLVDSQVAAYSKIEAENTVIRRMKLLGGIDPEIDEIYGIGKEDEMKKKLGDE